MNKVPQNEIYAKAKEEESSLKKCARKMYEKLCKHLKVLNV